MQLYDGVVDLRALENSDCCKPEVRPGYIKFGSGEGWTISHWTSWGGQIAVSVGEYHNHVDVSVTSTVTLTTVACTFVPSSRISVTPLTPAPV